MDRGEQGFSFFHFPHFLISAREVRERERRTAGSVVARTRSCNLRGAKFSQFLNIFWEILFIYLWADENNYLVWVILLCGP